MSSEEMRSEYNFNHHGEDGLAAALGRQWGSAPWYFGSIAMHLFVFAILLLFAPAPRVNNPDVIISATLPPDVEPIIDKPEDEPLIDLPPDIPPDDTPLVAVEPPVVVTTPEFEAVSPADDDQDIPPDNPQIAELPDDLSPATMGVGLANYTPGPKGDPGNLRELRKKRKKNPDPTATKEGKEALKRGLKWLAYNQEPDGSWNCSKHGGGNNDVSVTALAMLAFLGEGSSTITGTYRRNIIAAQHYLLSKYRENPGIIGNYRYEAAITMMAISESLAMSGRRELKPVVQKLADYAVSTQATNGGWGYTPDRQPQKAHVDSSVAGWWMMGLKSAKLAGAEIPEQNWKQAVRYFESVTKDKGGYVTSGYQGPGESANLTAVGLTCLQFLGMSRNERLVKGQADYFLNNPEKMMNRQFTGGNPYYGWYYQALGFFQMGTKSTYWRKFAPVMQKVLVDLQVSKGFNRGAWPVKLPWSESQSHFEGSVGMVGTTAMSCLMLEVFWRFADVHKSH